MSISEEKEKDGSFNYGEEGLLYRKYPKKDKSPRLSARIGNTSQAMVPKKSITRSPVDNMKLWIMTTMTTEAEQREI